QGTAEAWGLVSQSTRPDDVTTRLPVVRKTTVAPVVPVLEAHTAFPPPPGYTTRFPLSSTAQPPGCPGVPVDHRPLPYRSLYSSRFPVVCITSLNPALDDARHWPPFIGAPLASWLPRQPSVVAPAVVAVATTGTTSAVAATVTAAVAEPTARRHRPAPLPRSSRADSRRLDRIVPPPFPAPSAPLVVARRLGAATGRFLLRCGVAHYGAAHCGPAGRRGHHGLPHLHQGADQIADVVLGAGGHRQVERQSLHGQDGEAHHPAGQRLVGVGEVGQDG